MDREDPTARKRREREGKEEKRETARERFARWRVRKRQESLNRMPAADNEYHRRRREGEIQEERQKRLAFLSEYRERIHLQQSQDIINQSIYFCESQVETQHCY
ncbi:hypothetical protein AVEN_21817-1 [Araneus ventricosus]|uniref:Uncharacterized protein n=1 Tax=Araneus ventricosus TaxID=182803 RepID=A0A4Y2PY41_ARAVE|nr:hypothetical protein AVEN_21817-1 [Araneus ventricosus]